VAGYKGLSDSLSVGLEDIKICGEINAKNGFGAYAGFKKFYAREGDTSVVFIDNDRTDDFAEKMCSSEQTIYQAR
jgi:hypothetical protein